jgi:hypothetical protein
VINDVVFIGQIAETVLPDGPLFEVAVIQHTQCGAGALADDTFRRRYADRIGADESTFRENAVVDPAQTVKSDVERLRSAYAIPARSPSPGTSTTSSPASCRRSSPPTGCPRGPPSDSCLVTRSPRTIVVGFSNCSGSASAPVAKNGRPEPKTTGTGLRTTWSISPSLNAWLPI